MAAGTSAGVSGMRVATTSTYSDRDGEGLGDGDGLVCAQTTGAYRSHRKTALFLSGIKTPEPRF